MDKIYTILIYLMIIPILVCIKNIKKFHNDISSSITRCLVFAIFTILGNGLFTLNINETISYLAMALYLFAYDLMLIYNTHSNILMFSVKSDLLDPDALFLLLQMVYLCF